jgi:hypothetical protein
MSSHDASLFQLHRIQQPTHRCSCIIMNLCFLIILFICAATATTAGAATICQSKAVILLMFLCSGFYLCREGVRWKTNQTTGEINQVKSLCSIIYLNVFLKFTAVRQSMIIYSVHIVVCNLQFQNRSTISLWFILIW